MQRPTNCCQLPIGALTLVGNANLQQDAKKSTHSSQNTVHSCSGHQTHLVGVGGVGDVVGPHVATEHRVKDLVGQGVALRGIPQQVARHLIVGHGKVREQ